MTTALRDHRADGVARWGAAIGLSAAMLTLGACQTEVLFDPPSDPPHSEQTEVKPEYQRLKDQPTAVLVATDENVEYTYPGATAAIALAVNARLHAEVKGIKLTPLSEIAHFQKQNPYWNTLFYRDLIDRLKVARLVFIDVAEYGVRKPDNAEVLRGTIDATISVIEKDRDDPTYSTTIRVVFPSETEKPLGAKPSHGGGKDIQTGLLKRFATLTAGRFNEKGASIAP